MILYVEKFNIKTFRFNTTAQSVIETVSNDCLLDLAEILIDNYFKNTTNVTRTDINTYVCNKLMIDIDDWFDANSVPLEVI